MRKNNKAEASITLPYFKLQHKAIVIKQCDSGMQNDSSTNGSEKKEHMQLRDFSKGAKNAK